MREEVVLVGATEPFRNLGIIAVCENSHVVTVVFAREKVAWPVYVFLPAGFVGKSVAGCEAPRRFAIDTNGPIPIPVSITTSNPGE